MLKYKYQVENKQNKTETYCYQPNALESKIKSCTLVWDRATLVHIDSSFAGHALAWASH